MQEFIYRLFSRRKYLLKSFFILSIIILASMVVAFLPQLASPHILGKYLTNFATGSENLNDNNLNSDFDFYIKSELPSFLPNFSNIIELTSQEVYGIYQPDECNLFTFNSITILNNSISEAYLIGVTSDLYQAINEHCLYSSTTGAIILSPFQNDTLGNYFVSYRNNETTLNASNKIEMSTFSSEFCSLNNHLSGLITNLPRFYFLQIDELISQYNEIVQNSNPPTYTLQGYIRFSQFQKDIIYWSEDSTNKINQFEEKLISNLNLVDNSATLTLQFTSTIENSLLIKLVYAFLHGIQFLVWGISIILCILTISKLQITSKNHELRTLFAGKNWGHRLSHHLLESLILVFSSCGVALAILYPFLKIQLIFQMTFSFDLTFLLQFFTISISIFILVFITYLDFEFYLRKTISLKSQNLEYKTFNRIPNYIKWFLPILFLFAIWLFDREILTLIVYICFLLVTIIIGYLAVVFVRGILVISMRFYYQRKKKKDKPLSLNYIILKLWNKRLKSKLFIYTFILTLISSAFLFANFTADAKRTEYIWWNGGEIEFWVPANNSTLADETLSKISKIIDYTKIIYFDQYTKGDEHYSYTLIGNVITEVDSAFIGERIDNIIGINSTDYLKFYQSWNKKQWLIDGDLDNFNGRSIIISQEIHLEGIEITNSIEFINDSYSFTTQGIINAWPSITDQFGSSSESQQLFIVDSLFLQNFLQVSNISYYIRYKLHTTEQDIQSVVSDLLVLLPTSITISELSYLDIEIFVGLRKVFLTPIIILSQLLFLLWGALYLYTNFEQTILSLQAKQLGIIALTSDYKHTLSRYLFFEGTLLYMAFFIIFGLMFTITYGFLQGTGLVYNIKSIIISQYTILNILFLVLYYPILLLIQSVIEYRKLKHLNLSLLYRHSE